MHLLHTYHSHMHSVLYKSINYHDMLLNLAEECHRRYHKIQLYMLKFQAAIKLRDFSQCMYSSWTIDYHHKLLNLKISFGS